MYVFDTNTLSTLGHYYPDRFPTFWTLFEELIKRDEAVSVREVRRELEDRGVPERLREWLSEWVQAHKAFFLVPTPEETEFVGEIFAVRHFQELVGRKQTLRGKPVADPFLIAAARIRGGCVVTQETKKPHAAKIPNVCEHFGVDYCDLGGFLERVGWTF